MYILCLAISWNLQLMPMFMYFCMQPVHELYLKYQPFSTVYMYTTQQSFTRSYNINRT